MNRLLWRNFRLFIICSEKLSQEIELHPRVNRLLNCEFWFSSPIDPLTDSLVIISKTWLGWRSRTLQRAVIYSSPAARLDYRVSSPPRSSCQPSKECVWNHVPTNHGLVQMLSFCSEQRLAFPGQKKSQVEKAVGESQAKETVTMNRRPFLSPGEPAEPSGELREGRSLAALFPGARDGTFHTAGA